jgi:di/tricarboxylate transporter
MTLIGTSPNIIASRLHAEYAGKPFTMFDFLPVGAAVTAVGVLYLAIAWRLLPERTPTGSSGAEQGLGVQAYIAELRFRPGSPMIGATVGDLERLGGGDLTVVAIQRGKGQVYVPGEHWRFLAGDVIVLETDPKTLQKVLAEGELEQAAKPESQAEPWEEFALMESVITPQSPLVGRSVEDFRLRSRYGVNMLAVGRGGRQYLTQVQRMALQGGDVVVLQGPRHTLPEVVAALEGIPLAYPSTTVSRKRRSDFSIPILAAAIILMSLGMVPVSVGFFGAAVVLLLTRHITIREAYEAIDVPILFLLACLIPVSDALQNTGATKVIADAIGVAAGGLPAPALVVLMLAAAMALTPVLNNAATVLVMAPIAVSLARSLAINPDALLMAVAIGAACDFLTPIGHQCNTLVMGPGGYRFGDYWRLGLPLSLLVLVVGSGAILAVWPVR